MRASYGRRCRTIGRITILLTAIILTTSAQAYSPDTDYMQQMIGAAVAGDFEAGTAAQEQRDEKIKAEGLSFSAIDFNDLYLLAKIMRAEAGDVSEEIAIRVGEVALNRVASPEFPDTLEEVLKQPGQYYYPSMAAYFESLTLEGYEHCVLLAVRLLEGERNMAPSVVFQDNQVHGSGYHTKLWSGYGWMYCSYSSNRELYG